MEKYGSILTIEGLCTPPEIIGIQVSFKDGSALERNYGNLFCLMENDPGDIGISRPVDFFGNRWREMRTDHQPYLFNPFRPATLSPFTPNTLEAMRYIRFLRWESQSWEHRPQRWHVPILIYKVETCRIWEQDGRKRFRLEANLYTESVFHFDFWGGNDPKISAVLSEDGKPEQQLAPTDQRLEMFQLYQTAPDTVLRYLRNVPNLDYYSFRELLKAAMERHRGEAP